jgi:hypothetical protein
MSRVIGPPEPFDSPRQVVLGFRIDRERRLHRDGQQDRVQLLRDIPIADRRLARHLQHRGRRGCVGNGGQFDLHSLLSGWNDDSFAIADAVRQSVNP